MDATHGRSLQRSSPASNVKPAESNVVPYLRLIDTATARSRHDVTPLFADAEGWSALVDGLFTPFAEDRITHVAGIDALGFALGGALARRAGWGFVAVRKGNKLPLDDSALVRTEFVDYTNTTKVLEIRKDLLDTTARVLVVDDWLETGTQVQAAVTLIEGLQSTVVGIATIAIDDTPVTRELRQKYKCHAVWQDTRALVVPRMRRKGLGNA